MTTTAEYRTFFATYDGQRRELDRWLERNYIRPFGLRPCRLLDAGCGNGFWTSLWAGRGYEVAGFDVDADLVADGRARYPDVRLDVASFEDASAYDVDLVFCRTAPQFYSERLEDVADIVGWLARFGAPMLLSAFTDDSGKSRMGLTTRATMHRHADFIAAVEQVATVRQVERAGSFLQVMATCASTF